MVEVIVVVRELRTGKPDFSLKFELPSVPAVGTYISVNRPFHKTSSHSEDMIVKKVWWRLHHPEDRPIIKEGEERTGTLTEIFVECDPALGPHAGDRWRQQYEGFAEDFGIVRFNASESRF